LELRIPRKRYSPEEIIAMLREVEVRLSQGETVGQICRMLAVSEQSCYRWRREYGGLNVYQAKRLKELEKENQRLRRAVSDLTLDAMILKEAARGKF
jgi:putative transposase